MNRAQQIISSPVWKMALLAATIAFASTVQSAGAQSAKLEKVTVADAKTTHHLNLYVAHELGYFKEQGIDVEIKPVVDLAAARDLVVSGEADILWSCPTVAIAAIANGAPLKVICQVKKPCTSVLLVPPESPIKTFSDLNGKRIAGISPTCEAVIALTVKAREHGGEFILEKLAGGPAIAALEARKVDAAILEEPHVSIAELKGYKVLFREASANIPCRTVNASEAFLKKRPDTAKRFVKALEKANAFILKDPAGDRLVDIAVQYTGAPPEAIRFGNHRLKFTTTVDTKGLSLLADELIKLNNIKENPGDKLYAQDFKGVTWK